MKSFYQGYGKKRSANKCEGQKNGAVAQLTSPEQKKVRQK